MGAGARRGLVVAGGTGLFQDSLAAGTLLNLGKVTDAGMYLLCIYILPDQHLQSISGSGSIRVTFDEVGGLDNRHSYPSLAGKGSEELQTSIL